MTERLAVPVGIGGVEATFGRLTFGPDGRLTAAWERAHLGLFELPYPLDNEVIPGGHQVTHLYCHRLLGPVFQDVFRAIDDAGLREHAMGYGGCFNVRSIRGRPGHMSLHAYGVALDLNAHDNPLGSDESHQHPDVVALFKAHGFHWGGDFVGRKDPQHFQYAAGC